MKKTLMTILLLGLYLPTYAHADSARGFYAGGGAASIDLKGDDDISWSAIEAIGGYKLNPFVGGEARVGFASDTPDLFYTSLYYRTESLNDTAKTYLLLGYTIGKVDGEDDSTSVSGVSYGAGVGFPVTLDLFVNFEYRMIMNGSTSGEDENFDVEMQGFAINVDYRF